MESHCQLRDTKARIAVDRRINRIELGNFDDQRFCRDGVWELRIDVGSGYRVSYAVAGTQVVLPLCGGDKQTQDVDIDRACEYLSIFLYPESGMNRNILTTLYSTILTGYNLFPNDENCSSIVRPFSRPTNSQTSIRPQFRPKSGGESTALNARVFWHLVDNLPVRLSWWTRWRFGAVCPAHARILMIEE
jgi:putative addiction module killer protein